MAYGAGAPGAEYGWWFGEQREDRSSPEQQAEWANMQIQRAKGGETLTGYFDAGKGIGRTSTPSSMQESPQSANAAKVIAAYWLAVAAQDGRYSGWSPDGVAALIAAAEALYEEGKPGGFVSTLFGGGRSDSDIAQVFTEAGKTLAQIAANQPPLQTYDSYLLKFQQMGSLDSIAWSREMADASNLGVGEAIVGTAQGTAADVLHTVGIGEGGAVAAQKRRDELAGRGKNRALLIGGGIVLALGVGYFFFVKD